MEPRLTSQTIDVLASFAERPSEPLYGLEVIRMTGLKSGTLYPILARLESAKWLESSWDDRQIRGPRRRLYRLTGEGERAASGLSRSRRAVTAKPSRGFAAKDGFGLT